MASAAENRGNSDDNSPTRLFTRDDANAFVAKALGIAMRGGRHTNEKLEQITALKDRRIEKLRSYEETTPVYLEDVLSLAVALGAEGPRFLTSILAEVGMYASPFNGASPEKIAGQIIQLATLLTGEKIG
jgi:hypothetical protein